MERSETKKRLREKQENLMSSAFDSNPDLHIAKKILFCGLVCLLAFRIILIATEIIVIISNGLPLKNSIFSFIGLIVVFLYSWGIYAGVKPLAILALFGGGITIIRMIMNESLWLSFQNTDILTKVYSFILITSALIQTITMILFITNKKCTEYFIVKQNITKELSDYSKSLYDQQKS